MNVVSATMAGEDMCHHRDTWHRGPSRGLCSFLRDLVPRGAVFSPRDLGAALMLGTARALGHPPSMDLGLARVAGPDSAQLLGWAQPQRLGNWGRAAQSTLWTPWSRTQATTPGGTLFTNVCGTPVPLTWADVSAPSRAAAHLTAMCEARRHPSSLHPASVVLSIHLPLGKKCGCAKAEEPVSPALSLSKQPVWAPEGWQGSGQSCGMGLRLSRRRVAPLGLGSKKLRRSSACCRSPCPQNQRELQTLSCPSRGDQETPLSHHPLSWSPTAIPQTPPSWIYSGWSQDRGFAG